MVDIYAGENALKTIQQHGFKQELFTNFLGASGGPKWFTLFGLDKYLFGEFFNNRTTELNLIGSSAGAFRAACFAQNNPVAAIKRLADCYSHTIYSDKPTPAEITVKARELLAYVYGEHGCQEIIDNNIIKAHFIVAKSKGLVASEHKLSQLLGLLSSYTLNRFDRKYLKYQYQRIVYHAPASNIKISDQYQFDTQYLPLTNNNIHDALLASGSIPLVMQGIKDIADSPKGMYRDGGIIDYHFDIALEEKHEGCQQNISKKTQGLTLYPHFNSNPKPGWFDKNSKRTPQAKHYDNIVMLVPSAKFVQSLPYQKIPDRKDFENFDAATRIKYWQTVLSETDRLATSFADLLAKQNFSQIMAFEF